MPRPILLDLFCAAGGAAKGYHEAGFDVFGVDHKHQKRYPYNFIQCDALEYLQKHGREYDAIHASAPCQKFCSLRSIQKDKAAYDAKHPDLIAPTRELLIATGKPWIIENVVGAPLLEPVMLCGSMFGLQTKCGAVLQRHRLFERNCFLLVPMKCVHSSRVIGVYGTHGAGRTAHDWRSRTWTDDRGQAAHDYSHGINFSAECREESYSQNLFRRAGSRGDGN